MKSVITLVGLNFSLLLTPVMFCTTYSILSTYHLEVQLLMYVIFSLVRFFKIIDLLFPYCRKIRKKEMKRKVTIITLPRCPKINTV